MLPNRGMKKNVKWRCESILSKDILISKELSHLHKSQTPTFILNFVSFKIEILGQKWWKLGSVFKWLGSFIKYLHKVGIFLITEDTVGPPTDRPLVERASQLNWFQLGIKILEVYCLLHSKVKSLPDRAGGSGGAGGARAPPNFGQKMGKS